MSISLIVNPYLYIYRALICLYPIKGPSIQRGLNGKCNNLRTAIFQAVQHFSKPVEVNFHKGKL